MKNCGTCGYYRQSEQECGNYFGPKAQAKVKPEDSCKEYATPIECDVRSVYACATDCAKFRKMLESRLWRLEKNVLPD